MVESLANLAPRLERDRQKGVGEVVRGPGGGRGEEGGREGEGGWGSVPPCRPDERTICIAPSDSLTALGGAVGR